MSRVMDKPLAAALWLAIFGAAAQGVADDACRTPAAQSGSSVTVSVADARPVVPPTSCDSKANSAAAVPPATEAPRYADAPKRSPQANPRSGRGSK
jgi:hypothetical protein